MILITQPPGATHAVTFTYGRGFEPARLMQHRIADLEAAMLSIPQSEYKVREYFAPGMYAREATIKAGHVLIGAVHRTENFAVLSAGRMRLVTDDGSIEVAAPYIHRCMPGVKNAAYAIEDCVWTNFFPTTETDPAKLAELLTESTLDEMIGGPKNKQAMHLQELARKETSCLGNGNRSGWRCRGAIISGNKAEDAAEAQAAGSAAGIAENARQFDLTRADQKPFMDAGVKALGTYVAESDVPLDLTKIQMDPGYEFARAQGQQGIDRQTAAAGGRISGAALKAASEYNTNMATNGYSTAYARQNQARADRLNRLAELAGIGQVSTNNVGALGAQTANNNSQLLVNQGNNAGAAALAQGNIWGNATNQLAAMAGKYYKDNYGRSSTPPPSGPGETNTMGYFN